MGNITMGKETPEGDGKHKNYVKMLSGEADCFKNKADSNQSGMKKRKYPWSTKYFS